MIKSFIFTHFKFTNFKKTVPINNSNLLLSEGFPAKSILAIFFCFFLIPLSSQIIDQHNNIITDNPDHFFINDLVNSFTQFSGFTLLILALMLIIISFLEIVSTKRMLITESDLLVYSRFFMITFSCKTFPKKDFKVFIYSNGYPISNFNTNKRKRYDVFLVNSETKIHVRMFYTYFSEDDSKFLQLLSNYSIPIDESLMTYLTV